TRKALRQWVDALKNSPLSAVLAAFGVEPSQASGPLVERFRKVSLVREDDLVLVLDESLARALRHWLQIHEPNLIQQLHYLWLAILRMGLSATDLTLGSSPPGKHGILKRAAWHAAQITGETDWRSVNLADEALP